MSLLLWQVELTEWEYAILKLIKNFNAIICIKLFNDPTQDGGVKNSHSDMKLIANTQKLILKCIWIIVSSYK